ncbi:MAG TPA: heat-inducible transcriptional repressor HrcA [Acidobacteriaceae bacterium]|jgi:heat-inducible transcriptional repressor|nr:heat-inducible transcriptional repressor HrcA [Acidobacteriaceae bacterium]
MGSEPGFDGRISPRERAVLTAIIETYIATGEPVASHALARHFGGGSGNREGMSPATIRNVMAALGDAGLLDQPHTSSGRIPTARAFRLYVEFLGGPQAAILAPARMEQIEESFAGIGTSQQYLERTSHVLALISSGLGVALATAQELHKLEHLHFSRLSPGRVLAVVITKAGTVLDRVLTLDGDLTMAELDTAARFLNENFHGWSIERIRGELARRLEAERSEYDRLMQSLDELYRKGALETETSAAPTIFMEGVANLLAGETDRARLRTMLQALEAKERLIELLNAYVDARQRTVRVVVGLEEAIPELKDFVLFGATARLGAETFGTVAVIGPTRIQYQETINAVSYIAELSGRIFQPPH